MGSVMDRVAMFVDAGYLYAGGAKCVSGIDGAKRHEITLSIPLVIPYLIKQAEAISQQKLLRIYWYDAAPSGRPTTDHQILASTDNVKLRLGVINGFGQQKGVDGKIITDLTELARNRAFADAVLLGGDEDLRLGVELAQQFGIRVHLLTIEGSTCSPGLRQESDTTTVFAREELRMFVTVRSPSSDSGVPYPAPAVSGQRDVQAALPPSADTMATKAVAPATMPQESPALAEDARAEELAKLEIVGYLAALSSADRVSLVAALRTGAGVPAEHDGQLLARTRNAIGRPLTQPEKAKLRRMLKSHLGV